MTKAQEQIPYDKYKTWNTPSDASTFLSYYNHDNNYTDYTGYQLKVGDTITINDGTYNINWVIAGLDCEKSRTASDGTLYDNGYGIALVPKMRAVSSTSKWNNDNTVIGAYYSSTIRNNTLSTIATNLQNILGDHLINRNVLLSNSIDSDSHSNGYVWTNDYCTLLSCTQLGKQIATGTNKYDDGEANYKLDLYSDNASRKNGNAYWTRSIWGADNYGQYAWCVFNDGTFGHADANYNYLVHPLIYIH